MKKYIAIALFGFYLLLQIGITTNIHTCHNAISDIQLFQKTTLLYNHTELSDCCSASNSEHLCCNTHASCSIPPSTSNISCCTNTIVLLQYLNNTQIPSQSPIIQIFPKYITNDILLLTQCDEQIIQTYSYNEYSSPPPEDLISLYCTFVFYG